MTADEIRRILVNIRKKAEACFASGKKLHIPEDDYYSLMCYFCRGYARQFGDFPDQKTYMTPNGPFTCSETVVCWFNDALNRLNDAQKLSIRNLDRVDIVFRTILSRLKAGYFRTRTEDHIAGAIHRHLTEPNKQVSLHEKSPSIMTDWWKGACWLKDAEVRKYCGSDFYADYPVSPFWEALDGLSAVKPAAITEGMIVRHYTLYLLELNTKKYLVHRTVVDVFSSEFETFKSVSESALSPGQSESEQGGERWWMRDPRAGVPELRMAITDMLAGLTSPRDRFILYLYACGYAKCEEIAAQTSRYIRHFVDTGRNPPFKAVKKSMAHIIVTGKIETLLNENGLDTLDALDIIAETLEKEMELSAVNTEN